MSIWYEPIRVVYLLLLSVIFGTEYESLEEMAKDLLKYYNDWFYSFHIIHQITQKHRKRWKNMLTSYCRRADRDKSFKIAIPYTSPTLMNHWKYTTFHWSDFYNPLYSAQSWDPPNGWPLLRVRRLDFWQSDDGCRRWPWRGWGFEAPLSYCSFFVWRSCRKRNALSEGREFEAYDIGRAYACIRGNLF